MDNRSSMTALMSAFARAYHFKTEKRPVFSDSAAERLMTEEEYGGIAKYVRDGIDFFAPELAGKLSDSEALGYIVSTQLAPTPLARAAFCEESLKTAAMTGTEQYVIIGAGYDTFALRENAFVSTHTVFELDHPLTQADKLERIKRAGLSYNDNVKFVPVDLSSEDMSEKLPASGFDCGRKSFFSWLGVSYYLSEEEIGRTLQSIAKLCSEGSSLVFDFGDEGLFDSTDRRVKNMLAMAMAAGEPMKSSFDKLTLARLLEKHGFLIYELLTPADIEERYFCGRDTIKPFPHIDMALAVYKP
ncbi:MAG: class I SAM-dependent methyltransferase [Huintestinicola sp.]|uniref:class I SAM-dependent methyltransferase n=1 Tax=Huintestinicola sp. TaxID=2981661 RepID=UPI003F0A5694